MKVSWYRLFYVYCMLSVCSSPALAADNIAAQDLYPQFSDTFDYVYGDYEQAYGRVFHEDAVPYWWLVGVSTVALIALDEQLLTASESLGRDLGIASEDKTTTFYNIGQFEIRFPTDLGSSLYFIGDGWTHSIIAAAFLGVGAWNDDDKAYNTGFQIIEGMITTTIATQTIKHITGRESPFRATEPAGRWDFFPNQQTYMENIPAYDAFPSGHLAVGSMVLTVIHKNYPEKTWVLPTGVTLLSLLSFQMMNNGVHWASDYPLAIALGYTFGSIAYERGQNMQDDTISSHMSWAPIVEEGQLGLGFHYIF
ncbi:MAG: phosphatase PAP2 family protein [Mariprofundaceae bacterium]|nr:phosphatase PAP2 family protein [Mariprofundaceae bacterium]